MAKMRYLGVSQPKAAFDELRPFRNKIMDMKKGCRPFHSDYLILDALDKALVTAAFHFTGDHDFYSLKPEQSRARSDGTWPDPAHPGRDGS